ncbi:MAG TPA: restriction endonuclease, partial [Thermoanaerobaculia bacterium]|nr:restriction endonuclease [Thermoanaerobaculia bacterium]
LPVLVDRRNTEVKNPWGVRYATLFHMTNDSELFRTSAQLKAEGFYPIVGKRWKKGESLYLPLYEGKMVQAYDHRAASVAVNAKNLHRPAQPLPAMNEQKTDPDWLPTPQFWVQAGDVDQALGSRWSRSRGWCMGFKEITAPTNERTMIAAIIPAVGAGNKFPLLLGETVEGGHHHPLLLACMGSFALDFVLRQKLIGQTINLFILEQLPFPTPDAFAASAGRRTLGEQVLTRVLRLTYTAHDLEPFSRELAYSGPPFAWDEEERRHLLAQLDAIMFQLYGLGEDDIGYMLSTFTKVEKDDRLRFGRYRTRELILGYLRAHAADDYSSRLDI